MGTCYVFDLDGTLIDSRLAVENSYRDAGVEMPVDAWGKPWHHWLVDVCSGDHDEALRIHELKNKFYVSNLDRYGRVLPLADLARSLIEAGEPVYVITGGSIDAATTALKRAKIDLMVLYDTEASIAAKSRILHNLWYETHSRGVYFDDMDGVRVPHGWMGVRVK